MKQGIFINSKNMEYTKRKEGISIVVLCDTNPVFIHVLII